MPKNTFNFDQLKKFSDRISQDPGVWHELEEAINAEVPTDSLRHLTDVQLEGIFGGKGRKIKDAFDGLTKVHGKDKGVTIPEVTDTTASALSEADEFPQTVIDLINKTIG